MKQDEGEPGQSHLIRYAESLDCQLRNKQSASPTSSHHVRGKLGPSDSLIGDELVTAQERIARALLVLHGVTARSATQSINQTVSLLRVSDHHFEDVPTNIGRFSFSEMVGRGGFGRVYRATDQLLHRDVAIKVLPRLALNGSNPFQEARAAAKLSHPYLVPVFEVLSDEKYSYLVSEYCDGPSLLEHQRTNGHPMPILEIIGLVIQISQAVAHAHSRGLAHRDIKPSNVMLTGELLETRESLHSKTTWTPRLTDFGLTLDLEQAGAVDESDIVGTLPFMAPEQLQRSPNFDPRQGDQYAIGVLAYQVVTGQLPFIADDVESLVDSVCTKEPPPVRSLRTEASPDLEAVIQKCLKKASADRYEEVQDLVDDLLRCQDGMPVTARSQGFTEQVVRVARRRPIESGLLVSLVILTFACAFVLAASNRRLGQTGRSLQEALTLADLREREARSSANQRAAALREVTKQERLAARNERRAIEAAYRADLRQAFAACAAGDPSMALQIADQILEYADQSVIERVDWRLLHAAASCGWRRLQTAEHRMVGDESEDAAVEKLMVVPQRNWIIIAQRHGIVRILDRTTGERLHEISLQHKGPKGFVGRVRCFAASVSSDGEWLAIGEAEDGHILSWMGQGRVSLVSLSELDALETGTHQLDAIATTRLTGFDATVESLEFSPSGRRLAVGIRYEPIQIIDLEETSKRQYVPSQRRNEMLSFRDENTMIITPTTKKSVCYDLMAESASTLTGSSNGNHLSKAVVSRCGRWLLCHYHASPIFSLKDLEETDCEPMQCFIDSGLVTSIAISPDGSHVVIGTSTGSVAAWNTHDFQRYRSTRFPSARQPSVDLGVLVAPKINQIHHDGAVRSLVVDEGNTVFSGGDDGSVATWPLVTDQLTSGGDRTVNDPGPSTLSSDQSTVFVGMGDGSLLSVHLSGLKKRRLIETDTPRLKDPLSGMNSVISRAVASSPDGSWVALGSANHDMWLVGVGKTPHPIVRLRSESLSESGPSSLVFSPASTRLAVLQGRSLIEIYDVPNVSSSAGGQESGIHRYRTELQPVDSLNAARGIRGMAFCDEENLLLFGDHIRRYRVGESFEKEIADGVQDMEAFYQTKHRIFVGSLDGRLRAFDLDGRLVASSRRWSPYGAPTASNHLFTSVTYCAADDLVLAGSDRGEIGLWDAKELRFLGSCRLSDSNRHKITNIHFSEKRGALVFTQRRGFTFDRDAESKLVIIPLEKQHDVQH
ncbi:MAG: WD40 repeat domain-containing serine/threonine protein kinase [Planctomycetota bacterium]